MTKKKDNIINNYLKKRKLIEKSNKFYYDQDKPILTDSQYDNIKKETSEIEKSNSFLKKYGSVNEKVGFKPSSKFKKIKHSKPMLSLANAFSMNDVDEFIKKINNYLNNKNLKLLFSLEPKIDGISASLTY